VWFWCRVELFHHAEHLQPVDLRLRGFAIVFGARSAKATQPVTMTLSAAPALREAWDIADDLIGFRPVLFVRAVRSSDPFTDEDAQGSHQDGECSDDQECSKDGAHAASVIALRIVSASSAGMFGVD